MAVKNTGKYIKKPTREVDAAAITKPVLRAPSNKQQTSDDES
jgi:hypothetical protein